MYIFQTICAVVLLVLIIYVYIRKWFFKGLPVSGDGCGCEDCQTGESKDTCNCGHDHVNPTHQVAQKESASCNCGHEHDNEKHNDEGEQRHE